MEAPGGGDLVDTKGNYIKYDVYNAMSREEEDALFDCQYCVKNDTLMGEETYAIKLVYTSETWAPTTEGTYGLSTLKEEITGNIDQNGNYSFKIKTTIPGAEKYAVNSSLVYDASDMKVYRDYYVKYAIPVTEGENPLATQYSYYVFPFTLDKTNPKSILETAYDLSPAEEQGGDLYGRSFTGMAMTGNTVKLRYEGETSIWIPDITATCTIYTVCNRTKNKYESSLVDFDVYDYEFVGAKVEMSFTKGSVGEHDYVKYNAIFEIAPSTTPVTKLTDAEKAEYIAS